MKLLHFVAPALLAASLAAPVAAADTPRYSFECDTPAAHFSYWSRTVSSREIEVSGKITVNELLVDKKWSPGAHVFFQSGKEKPVTVGIRIYSIRKTPEFLILELLKPDGGEAIGLGRIPNTRDPIPFTLAIDSAGLMKATVAGAEASASLGDFKPDAIQLTCSTGDFEFTDVTVIEKP